MGAFDTIRADGREGQVKLWDCTMQVYEPLDRVPETLITVSEYSIAMREGGFVNIVDGYLVSWTDAPMSETVFDKYGDVLDEETTGLLDELLEDPYLFSRESERNES